MGNPTKYDQTIKNSDLGKLLYAKWLRIHNTENCCDEFKDFIKFYDWAIGTGYQAGLTMLRHNKSKPYSPENCYWVEHIPKQEYGLEYKRSIEKFNEAVNRIRKHYGMKPLEEANEETQTEENEEGEQYE